MWISAPEFIDTINGCPKWMSLGGKTDKVEMTRRVEFIELKQEAERAYMDRFDRLFIASSCFFLVSVSLILLGLCLSKMGEKSNFFGLGIVPLPVTLLILAKMWKMSYRRQAMIKLDDSQAMLYEDVKYLSESPWLPADWAAYEEKGAKEHWLQCLYNMAAKVNALEHKLSLPEYSEKFADEVELSELRLTLSEHLRILRQFKLVDVIKADLFKELNVAVEM
jgi:hypothetical protein